MNYQDTVNWMFSQLPMYQNQGQTAYKADLTNSIELAGYLGNPENNFKSIHIGGTNGKGSTAHLLASVLGEAGLKVGLYTSPHLVDFRERIRIDGIPVSKQFVIGFIRSHKAYFEARSLSFFEMTVGMAFSYFAKKKVDLAVIEVGLGGRLDSTNIIKPELSVITNIGFDHMRFLGDTLEKIAAEKAGIIKPSTPVVIGETQEETEHVFKRVASSLGAAISFADKDISGQLPECELKGKYQQRNIRTVLKTIEVLRGMGYTIDETHINEGLKNVKKNTGLRGRYEVLGNRPRIICDTAHNREGLSLVLQQLSEESFDNLHMVIGSVNDKDLSRIVDLFPDHASYYFCKPDILRGLEADALKQFFGENGIDGQAFKSVWEAFESALKRAGENDLIFVGGSTFVVSEVLANFE